MNGDQTPLFCFGEFELDPHSGELRRGTTRVSLQEQPLQVLSVLLQDAGKLVRREELRHKVWPQNTFVEFDQALNTAVKKIRVALGDCAETPRYVETIPKRGYRFIALVTTKNAEPVTVASIPWGRSLPRRWILLSAVLALLLLLCFRLLGMQWRAAGSPAVLAVLPLEDLSDNASLAAFGDGLGDELTTQLGHSDPAHVAVTSRVAALPYRHTNRTVSQAARELHAAYLLAGCVRGDARRVRVTLELIRTSDELQIWGDVFDREMGDTLTLERDLSAEISGKVGTALATEIGHKR